jgi:hypothetical protein
MAIVPMLDAVVGDIASASEYNKLIDNILDLDGRVTGLSNSRPSCHVYQTSTGMHAIGYNTPTAVNFNGEVSDPHNFHSTTGNISRITPTVAGRYLLIGGVCIETNNNPIVNNKALLCQFRKNGLVAVGSSPYGTASLYQSTFIAPMAHTVGSFSANGTTDYFELWANTDVTGGVSTFSNATDQHPFAIALYMGA